MKALHDKNSAARRVVITDKTNRKKWNGRRTIGRMTEVTERAI
jgi:hypothetical protein